MRYFRGAALLMVLVCAGAAAGDVKRTVASWPEDFGNHRARVQVAAKADAVAAYIPWRRPDSNPEKKRIMVVDAATGKTLSNVTPLEINRESGVVVFQPVTAPGEYHIYYMPYTVQPGWGGYSKDYLARHDTADPLWRLRTLPPLPLPRDKWKQLPQATLLDIQARGEFERFDPMEVIATAEELSRLLAANRQPYLLFPEDRKHPIRMTDDLPLRWIESGPGKEFRGQAAQNEYYALQIGVYAARQDLQDVQVEFSQLRSPDGNSIPAEAMRCFNLGGTDWLGRPFHKGIVVPKGKVQALWCGVDIPEDAAPGDYRGAWTLRCKNAEPRKVDVSFVVADTVLEDRGDSEPWRHSRLRWLDSTIGSDDEVVPPYTPLQVAGRTVGCLGRQVRFAATGLPESMRCNDREILAGPVTFVVETGEAHALVASAAATVLKQSPGSVVWTADSKAGPLLAHCRTNMEFDGHLDFEVTFKADQPTELKDIRLEIPLHAAAATYLMGIGRKGGLRPREWSWKWGGPVYYDSFWLGDVPAGLQCELRGASYCGPMVNLYWRLKQLEPPEAWHNEGRGGCTVREADGKRVVATAYSGPRRLLAGEALRFEFALLLTPVKPLNTAEHFRERYYHHYGPVDEAVQAGANVINIHHATEPNPYINYPFLATEKLAAYVKEAHEKNAKVKIYYTVRELTNHTVELWALRSLGHEVLAPGSGGGYPWLREHLRSDYSPAWYHRFPDGEVCAAVVTSGASRWYNYYLEGLNWLLGNVEIDGLYLDDVTYDRQILKRMRKIMNRTRPDCLIDLHSNTAFSCGPANQYMEFFPYIDRLWFGESFNYDESPDYWLVEISGIPFGLMGEMLEKGGNPWRGMIYGMTARLPYLGDPRPLWKLWDEFGISDARMVGYWDPACPVSTTETDVLATAYVKQGKTLVAVASWAKRPMGCRLKIDWRALGLDAEKAVLTAPAIEGFQPAARFRPTDEIPVTPGRGWLLIVTVPPLT